MNKEFLKNADADSDSDQTKYPAPMKLKKPGGLRYKDSEKCRYWIIANLKCITKDGALPYGRTIIARQWKDKPYKITFQILDYQSVNGVHSKAGTGKKDHCFSVRNGKLNIYSRYKGNNGEVMPDGTTVSLKNVSTTFSITALGVKEPVHIKRVARVLNQFLKENNFKGRIKNVCLKSFKNKAERFRVIGNPMISLDGKLNLDRVDNDYSVIEKLIK